MRFFNASIQHFTVLLIVFTLASDSVVAEVKVKLAGQPISIEASNYSARIEPDGCLTNLKLDGKEFLAPGVSISRGSYFYFNGPLKLEKFNSIKNNVVEAAGETAVIRYEFKDHGMQWRLTNKSTEELVFFIVLNGYVGAVSIDGDNLQKTPINGNYSHANFLMGDEVLLIEGFDKLWGPWQGPHQIIQATLKPNEKRSLDFQFLKATNDQRLQILQMFASPEESQLTITSPRNYQVIQRMTREKGRVLVSGHTRLQASHIEMRLQGESLDDSFRSWQHVSYDSTTRQFSTWLTLPAGGWYRLEVRALNQDKMFTENAVDYFGVGEVFVGAGQSNSTNSGQFKTKQTTGMVASFSGTDWQLADDPQPGVADRSQGGSFWPAFGDALYREYGVPIGVATTGYGGTSVNQWQPAGDLFQHWLLARIHQLGPQGFRAILWHQGESDVHMPGNEYYAKLKNTILSSVEQAGWEFPWFVAQATYHNPEQVRFESIRSAQNKLCQDGYALLGPDTDLLTGDHRDLDGKGIHLSPKGLKAHGEMWAEKVIPYLNSVYEAEKSSSKKSITSRMK